MSHPESEIQPEAPDYRTPYIEPQAQQQEAAKLGPLQRLIGVLFSPGETFADINRKPTWLAPLIISIILGMASTLFLNWWVNPDWNRIAREQIRQRINKTGGEMPPENIIEQQVKVTGYIGKFFPLALIIFVPITFLVIGGIFALGMMLLQAQTTFKKILSVVSWTYCSVGLVSGIVTDASLMVRDRESLDAINPMDPGAISATNLSVVLASGTSPALKAIASSLDLFTIWILIVLIIGLTAIAGSRKINKGKTATMVVSLWLVWVALRVLSAIAFGTSS